MEHKQMIYILIGVLLAALIVYLIMRNRNKNPLPVNFVLSSINLFLQVQNNNFVLVSDKTKATIFTSKIIGEKETLLALILNNKYISADVYGPPVLVDNWSTGCLYVKLPLTSAAQILTFNRAAYLDVNTDDRSTFIQDLQFGNPSIWTVVAV